MDNRNEKQNKQYETILTNFVHDGDVIAILSRFNLRMFYTNGLRIGIPVSNYNDIEKSYVECDVHTDKSGKPDYICGDSNEFSIILHLQKLNGLNYTYSKVTYYDKLKRKPYEFVNQNVESKGIGASIKRLLYKKKK